MTVGFVIRELTVGFVIRESTVGFVIRELTVGFVIRELTVGFVIRQLTVGFVIRELTVGFVIRELTVGFVIRELTVGFVIRQLTVGFVIRALTIELYTTRETNILCQSHSPNLGVEFVQGRLQGYASVIYSGGRREQRQGPRSVRPWSGKISSPSCVMRLFVPSNRYSTPPLPETFLLRTDIHQVSNGDN